MLTQEFRQNRRLFAREELAKYRGQWLAFSPDGRRIVASAETLLAPLFDDLPDNAIVPAGLYLFDDKETF